MRRLDIRKIGQKTVIGLFFFFLPLFPMWADVLADMPNQTLRSFDDLFPGFQEDLKRGVFSRNGLVRSVPVNQELNFIPSPASGIDLLSIVMQANPSFLAESLLVIPYRERRFSLLDVYNALGMVRNLQGRSQTGNTETLLFSDATRIESAQRLVPIPDPPPARELPSSETVFLRLRDINFGNTYYRGDISVCRHGISYKLTNIRALSFLILPVVRAGRFFAALYMEPLAEGLLVYSMAGADVSNLIISRVNVPSAIKKRLVVFIDWIIEGLEAQN